MVLKYQNVSVYPWDIWVRKEGDQIMLDKYQPGDAGHVGYLDFETTDQNTKDDMPVEEKDIMKQCLEATNICKSFARNTCFAPYHEFEIKPKGSKAKKSASSVGYKYRRFTLNEGEPIDIVVRSTVDAYQERNGKKKLLLLKTHNQQTAN